LYAFNSHSHFSTTTTTTHSILTGLPNSELNSLVSTLHGHHGKTACIVDKACLLRRCLAIDILLFRASASAEICLATRCLAMGMAQNTEKAILAISFLLLRVRISGVASKLVY
jgi:hypothetical protein